MGQVLYGGQAGQGSGAVLYGLGDVAEGFHHGFGLAVDDDEIGANGAVRLAAALFPVAHQGDRECYVVGEG